MSKALTKKMIEAAIAAGTDGKPYVMVWDTAPKGLGLRIRANGESWLFRYRPKGSTSMEPVKTITLGAWPSLSVDEARKLAIRHAAKIATGDDPVTEARQLRLRDRSVIGVALEAYEADLKRRGIVKAAMVMSSLRRGFAPVMSDEIDELDLRGMIGLVNAIPKAGAAGAFRRQAHGFLAWAAGTGLVKANVLGGYRAPKLSREERLAAKARAGRALSDAEIITLWNAASSSGSFGALVQAGMLTGLRRSELAGLRWTDIHRGEQGDVIVIPADRIKTGKEHRVPISAALAELLAEQPRSSRYVFLSRIPNSPIAGWTERLSRLTEAAGMTFRMHDLRKTCRTLMSRVGVSEAVAEAAIGHAKEGLVAVYDKHDHLDDRRMAFEKVGEHIARLIGDGETKISNVVALRRS